MHKPSLTRQTLHKDIVCGYGNSSACEPQTMHTMAHSHYGIAWIAGNAIAILHGKKKNDLLTSDKWT
ncbi:hypothetical protein E5358_07140 [Palleniella muris]|uniref:Uncharacterized protein n=1 Tax=Palleniella muris TaxID=3038145 RepID=A0AC61QQ58_9BACT|nr:hypothetical protein E5358_07140 [Palleniella muris]